LQEHDAQNESKSKPGDIHINGDRYRLPTVKKPARSSARHRASASSLPKKPAHYREPHHKSQAYDRP
jgi:hypothetical protein